MPLRLISIDSWDEDFFKLFISLQHQIYEADSWVLLEDSDDFYNFLELFSRKNWWRAWIAIDNTGRARSRLVASFPKDKKASFVSLGYFEARDKNSGADLLFEKSLNWAVEFKSKDCPIDQMKWPIQGNFFNSYRINKKDFGRPPFLGEPNFPLFYHDLVKAAGFSEIESWKTIEIDKPQADKAFGGMWKRSQRRWHKEGMSIRSFNDQNWDSELSLLHHMFHDSYSEMSDFSPMSKEQFIKVYKPFRHFIDPNLVLIAERHGVPEAFLISYFDPMPALANHQKRIQGYWARFPGGKLMSRLLMGAQLGKSNTRLLVPYIGKTKEAKAPWIVGALGYELFQRATKRGVDRAQICYIGEGSGTMLSLPKQYNTVGEYGLYGKSI